MNLNWIKSQVAASQYQISQHADDERMEDSLLISEIEDAISNCIILEDYQNDKRGRSCLLAGFTKQGKPIHIVCGKNNDILILITVYIPTPPKFISPYKRG